MTETTNRETEKFVEINLESIRINSMLNFDLYLKQSDGYILYRSSKLPFTERNRALLIENKVDKLFIDQSSIPEYKKYVESNLKSIIEDKSLNNQTRAKLVYGTARLLVKDILENPTLKKNIERSGKLVESTISFILNEEDAFFNLFKMMSFDYYTYTHSVNVCTFSVALARYSGITSRRELYSIGAGALLHDIGKTRVSDSIVNKQGKLTEGEFEEMKNHPDLGVGILRETDLLPNEAYLPVLEHHEREDGSGYPKGLHKFQINDYSKIVAIADVFDAMTTRRTYRPAVKSFSALKTMFAMRESFDPRLLEQFTQLIGPR